MSYRNVTPHGNAMFCENATSHGNSTSSLVKIPCLISWKLIPQETLAFYTQNVMHVQACRNEVINEQYHKYYVNFSGEISQFSLKLQNFCKTLKFSPYMVHSKSIQQKACYILVMIYQQHIYNFLTPALQICHLSVSNFRTKVRNDR